MKIKLKTGTTLVEFVHALTATVLEQEDELRLAQSRLDESRERLAVARSLFNMSEEDKLLPPTAPGREARHQTPIDMKSRSKVSRAKMQEVDRIMSQNPQGLKYRDIITKLAAKGYPNPKWGYYSALHGAVESERLRKSDDLYFRGPKAPKL